MPPTSTLVSTTPRRFRLLPFGRNGDLRRSPLLAIGANRPQDLLIGDSADVFCGHCQRFEKFLLPPPPFAASWQIPIQIDPRHSLSKLFPERTEWDSDLDRVLFCRQLAGEDDVFRILRLELFFRCQEYIH